MQISLLLKSYWLLSAHLLAFKPKRQRFKGSICLMH
jgi:hypothetical protein